MKIKTGFVVGAGAVAMGAVILSIFLLGGAGGQPFLFPLEASVLVITGKFGDKRTKAGKTYTHRGTDYAVPVGTQVVAPEDGVIRSVHTLKDPGLFIVMEGESGLWWSFSHLSDVDVKLNQSVERGADIAESGESGNATGPHLHLMVWKVDKAGKKTYLDPQWVLARSSAVEALQAKIPVKK